MCSPHAHDVPGKQGFESNSKAGSVVLTVVAPAPPASLCRLLPTPATTPRDGLAGEGLFGETGPPQTRVNHGAAKPLPKQCISFISSGFHTRARHPSLVTEKARSTPPDFRNGLENVAQRNVPLSSESINWKPLADSCGDRS